MRESPGMSPGFQPAKGEGQEQPQRATPLAGFRSVALSSREELWATLICEPQVRWRFLVGRRV